MDDALILPRSWDYQLRFCEPFKMQFRKKAITIKQSPQGSRVGATVWDICIAMCKFFEDDQKFPLEFFQKNRFIELGSGVGLLGIAFAAVGAEIFLTEQPKMLPLLQDNLKLNIKAFTYRSKVQEFWWGTDPSSFRPPTKTEISCTEKNSKNWSLKKRWS
eukprot:TRINITY_DN10528_c0_g1_i2.p1 TRINITY_DN10528_c0_g1~~TRINITY_DN10528_c0_g1_i2.p1  ORF type:complete len:168 (+),score=31.24 TRINITY_DN10528_c0_g1_i2:26-505(+)